MGMSPEDLMEKLKASKQLIKDGSLLFDGIGRSIIK
jgi:hypothetical protein